ncbi:MAG: DUF4340 domain-containing protein [Proteobacteria bacterium]|nr:DUF4340 domain-containing protein [Pseudomonadota bacterium]
MKKEYIVLALIIITLSAYLVFHKSDSTHYTLPVLEDLSNSDITRIDILHGTTPLTLEKNSDQWVVGDDKLPANTTMVTAMIKSIKDLKLTALVSESKSYNRYELDEDNRIRVSAWSKDKMVRTVDVGKAASSFKHTFVKLETDPRVYHAEENIRNIFNKTEDNLTDKGVLNVDSANVYQLQVTENGKTVSLVKKQEPVTVDVTQQKKKDESTEAPPAPEPKDTWTDASGKDKDLEKITGFVSLFSNLKCTNYIKGLAKDSLTDPILDVSITGDKAYTLSVFAKKEGEKDYPAVSSESAFPFTLPEAKVDDIKKKFGEI